MYKKKRFRMFITLFIAVILLVVAGICQNFQTKYRDDYVDVKNGIRIEATAHKLNETYLNLRNKYLYTFEVNGKTYGGITMGSYTKEEAAKLKILYAANSEGVRLKGTIKIEGKEYPWALSHDEGYFKISQVPGFALTVAVYILAGAVLAVFAYYFATFLMYRSLEVSGILTYGLFIEANASRAGSNRHMSIRFKFKNENEEWVEAATPYAYNVLDVEKLMSLGTFKVRYKGKKSMIAEDTTRVRIE